MKRNKKAKTKKRTSGRRRVGASAALNPSSPMVMLGSAAIGYFLADTINPLIDNVTGTMDQRLVGGIEGGLGAALMFMKLGAKKPGLLQVAAGGVIGGAGVKRLLKAFGVINGIGGYQSVPVIGQRMLKSSVNGYGGVPVLNGYTTSRQAMNGVFNGYNVPPVPARSSVVGSANGSGISTGSELMG